MSDYRPEIAPYAPRLEGPGRDVALMLRVLREAGFEETRITVLTDRPEQIADPTGIALASPTRDGILGEFSRLARLVAPDDNVLLYLAGHGTQTPVTGPSAQEDEPDGLDEVFLPADAGVQATSTGTEITNAIRDNEFGVLIDQMIAAGAHVWLIADTCHAGTLRRDWGTSALTPRMAAFDPRRTTVADQAAVLAEPHGVTGKFAAFYGARAGDLAYEMDLDVEGETVAHGLLTWALVKAVGTGARDYRALSELVEAHMSVASEGRARPEFAGALGLAPLLGRDPLADYRFGLTVKAEALILSAGRLTGLRTGDTMVIGEPDGTALGIAEVAEVGLEAARLTLPKAGGDQTLALDTRIASEGLDPARHRLAWLERRAARLVAWPVDPKGPRAPIGVRIDPELRSDAALFGALSELAGGTPETDPVILRIASTDNGLEVHHQDLASPLDLPRSYGGLETLRQMLERYRHAQHMIEVGAELSETALSAALKAKLETTASQAGTCPGTERDTPNASVPVVNHCDDVEITVHNAGDTPLSLSPFYIAPDGAVYYLSGYHGSLRGGLRLEPGARGTVRYREDTAPRGGDPTATGRVRLLLLAVEATELGQPPVDFRYLETGSATPGLRGAATVSPAAGLSQAGAVLIELETRPPEAAETLR